MKEDNCKIVASPNESLSVEMTVVHECRTSDFLVSMVVLSNEYEDRLQGIVLALANQTIGFEKNIQIIVVDSGASDIDYDIMKDCLEAYPENVTWLKLATACGVSVARNVALSYVRGTYFGFIDGTLTWDDDALDALQRYLNMHVDVPFAVASCCPSGDSSIRRTCSGSSSSMHTVDIGKEHSALCIDVAPCLYRTAMVGMYRFQSAMKYDNDAEFNTRVLIDHPLYGVVRDATCVRREVGKQTMKIDLSGQDGIQYLSDMNYIRDLLKLSQDVFGRKIEYVKQLIFCVLSRRFQDKIIMPADKRAKEYQHLLSSILGSIDDRLICEAENLAIEYKLNMLVVKYGQSAYDRLTALKSGEICFDGIPLFDLVHDSTCSITRLEIKDNTLLLQGLLSQPLPESLYTFSIRLDGLRDIPIKYLPIDATGCLESLGKVIRKKRFYSACIPLQDVHRIKLAVTYNDVEYAQPFYFARCAPIGSKSRAAYRADGGYLIGRHDNSSLWVSEDNSGTHAKAELKRLGGLVRHGHVGMALWRLYALCALKRRSQERPVWLFFDRLSEGDDNAEFILQSVRSDSRCEKIRSYYVVAPECLDSGLADRTAPSVIFGSLKHRKLMFKADMMISSMFDMYMSEPFGKKTQYVKELFHSKYIYLQHGIINTDCSPIVARSKRNFYFQTVTTHREYDSMFAYPYGYGEDEIKLVGLSRLDMAFRAGEKSPDKVILVAPTWRVWTLENQIDPNNGLRLYSNHFKETSFWKFYQALITDVRLNAAMKRYGYRGVLRLHPAFANQIGDFSTDNTAFAIDEHSIGSNYEKTIARTSLLVTDYSSIAFDYAYAGRTVVYAQFDKEEFFQNHIYGKGYFNYESDGFGPVCYDLDQTVQTLILLLQQDCRLPDPYPDRRKKYFTFLDDRNRERTLNAILEAEDDSL